MRKSYKINNNKHVIKKFSKDNLVLRNGFRPYVALPDGSVYIGNWKNDKLDGHGTRYFQNSYLYSGQWKDGVRNGYGTLRIENKPGVLYNIYIGEWKNDKKHGKGKCYLPDGIYFGIWKNNLRHGFGVMWYKNGELYRGDWEFDLFHGAGVYLTADSNQYIGFFSKGKRHGIGVYYHNTTGQAQKGIWYEGICKSSSMIDNYRQQAKYPTPSPIPQLKVTDPEELIKNILIECSLQFMDESDETLSKLISEIKNEK